MAARAGVRRAVLVHVSPRYDSEALFRLEAAAKARFERAEMGRDFQTYQVPLPDED
jgi:ribonuclease BN (tRNA processing enzyme)